MGTAAAVVGAAAVGSAISSRSSKKAAEKAADKQSESAQAASDAQVQATREQIAFLKEQAAQRREDYEPFRELGLSAQESLAAGLGLRDQGAQDSLINAFRNLPGRQFALDESQKAVQRAASAGGFSGSGRALTAISDRAQNISDLQFGDFLNRLAGLGGAGQSATNTLASLQASNASQIGSGIQNIGNAQASGFLNAGNAQASGILGKNNAIQGGIRDLTSLGGLFYGLNRG